MYSNFYKYAIETASTLVITDEKGVIIYANEKFCQLSGYSKDELIGNTHRILNSGYHDKSFFREMWQTITKGQIWRGEVCNRNKKGDIYWVSTVILPQIGDDNKPVAYYAFRTDVSARKQSEDLLDKITENIPIVVYVIDANTTETFFTTRAIYYLLGYTKTEIIKGGSDFTNTLFHPEDFAVVGKALEQTRQLKDGDYNVVQYRLKHKNGAYHWFESKEMVLERDKDGKASKILGFAQDISEKIEYIEMLKTQNQRLEEIAQLNAHAIRGPVASILGLTDILDADLSIEEQKQVIQHLKATAQKLDKVIHQVNEHTFIDNNDSQVKTKASNLFINGSAAKQ